MTEPLTLAGLLLAREEDRGGADALVFPDTRATFANLTARARGWAAGLAALGIAPGEHVGILLNTCPDFVEILFGVALAGAVAVPINARYRAGELAYLVENADLAAIVTAGGPDDPVDFVGRLHAALPGLAGCESAGRLACAEAPRLRHAILLAAGASPGFRGAETVIDDGRTIAPDVVEARARAVRPDDLALILYTSGTTANPKGCLITHRAIVGNSRNLARRYELVEGDRFWSPLPIFHIAGILPMVAIYAVGGAYLTIPHFEAGQALMMLERERATCAYPCFITIMQDLINHPDFAATDLGRVRMMNANFGVQPDWIRVAMDKAMPQAIAVGTYGLTEGAGTICTSRLDDSYDLRTQRLGVPLDDWQVRIVDAATGEDCAPGGQGEILAKGPHMLSGYYRDPVKTAATIDADGWLHTGDIGSIDGSGHIMFHGRLKDMLKVGGENVAAAEIETVLNRHPAVQLSQVVGVPDARYGEVAAAFVELAAGQHVEPEALIAFCRDQLAGFKIPRHVRFVTEWPMSTSKIQKFKLRDGLVAELKATAA